MNTNIKPRQHEILILLYKFRYLNRKQIQTLIKHKSHFNVQEWLNELIKTKYIIKYYEKKLPPEPAVYTLDNIGKRYLKNLKDIKIKPLDKAWRETRYEKELRDHCQLLGDIYISLLNLADNNKLTLDIRTKTELYKMAGLISPSPDAYFALKGKSGNTKRYLLEIFEDMPTAYLRRRVKLYMHYFQSYDWQDNTKTDFPEVILVCPNNRIKSHLYFFIQHKLRECEDMNIYLTTKEIILKNGLTSKTLEKVNSIE